MMANRMFGITIVIFIIIGVALAVPAVLISSSQKSNSFLLTLSLQSNNLYHIYSQTIADNQQHIIDVHTTTNPAVITPPISENNIFVNAVHQGRHLIQYYEPLAQASKPTDHFHFAEVFQEEGYRSYLLPAFIDKTPALIIEHLYRCSNTLISVDWYDGSAHIVAVSEDAKWTIPENIDNGHRGKDKGVSYIYAIDQGHEHPIRIDIGDNFFCQITRQTKTLELQYDFATKLTYQLKELLFLAKESLPIHRKPNSIDLDL